MTQLNSSYRYYITLLATVLTLLYSGYLGAQVLPPGVSIEICDNGRDDDGDGVVDCRDIDCYLSLECGFDHDNDGVLNYCDTDLRPGLDCNQNGRLDSCDVDFGYVRDCNGNRMPDECDIRLGWSDCNQNGWLDRCEIERDPGLDLNRDGVIDSCVFSPGTLFLRGDSNMDGIFDIGDAIRILDHLFFAQGSNPLLCEDSADFNDDGNIDITDPVLVLSFLTGIGLGGPPPLPGIIDCGFDPTPDNLGCRLFDSCP